MERKSVDQIEESFLAEEVVEEDFLTMAKTKETKAKTKSTKAKKATTKAAKGAKESAAAPKVAKEAKKPSIKIEKAISLDELEEIPQKEAEAKAQQSSVSAAPKVTVISPSGTTTNTKSKDTVSKTTTASSSSSSPKVNNKPWEEEDDQVFSGSNAWAILSAVLVILLLVSVFTNGFNFAGVNGEISLSEAESIALDYVNTNLLQAPFVAEVTDSSDEGEVYSVTLQVGGQEVVSFISKDGELFFPQGLDTGVTTSLDGSDTTDNTDTTDTTTGNTGTTDSANRDTIDTMGNAIKGDPNAKVTIVEFSDYECSYCGRFFEGTLPKIITDYIDTGKANLVYMDFPLDFHTKAQKSAEAAECAGEQGMYYEMHDKLFANQADLSEDNYKAWADEIGLNQDEFSACLDSGLMESEVKADMAYGQSLGISGTPAFLVNGELISGAVPYEEMAAAIDRALADLEASTGTTDTVDTTVPEPTNAVTEPVNSNGVSFDVVAKKWLFEPRDITVSQGDTVMLNIMPEGLDFTFKIDSLVEDTQVSADTTVTFTAHTKGTYEYYCSSCEDWRGMTGTLVVE